MKDPNNDSLTRKVTRGLSNAVKNFPSLGRLANGNDERGG